MHYRGRQGDLLAKGGRADGVVGFRWGFDHDGHSCEQTSFVLLAEGFLIAQPVLFTGDRRGWWYCDLVTVGDGGSTVTIEDLYVDVLVGPPDAPYQLLDLDELAAAVTAGAVDPATALDGLTRCQRFLDRRLHRREDAGPTWPDFPPSQVDSSRWTTLPREWQWRAHGGRSRS